MQFLQEKSKPTRPYVEKMIALKVGFASLQSIICSITGSEYVTLLWRNFGLIFVEL